MKGESLHQACELGVQKNDLDITLICELPKRSKKSGNIQYFVRTTMVHGCTTTESTIHDRVSLPGNLDQAVKVLHCRVEARAGRDTWACQRSEKDPAVIQLSLPGPNKPGSDVRYHCRVIYAGSDAPTSLPGLKAPGSDTSIHCRVIYAGSDAPTSLPGLFRPGSDTPTSLPGHLCRQ